ncbi:MAG: hypothetical protein A2600_07480 [Candidatus Lambdaproteobacteria bacterium RIFOXYD1_FULL_56_27]|nr:MAG: hypothetical protein A2426_00930 [Candidatus Lambdaproteobacteria bacterium RIFOXYC1_FULL_56_13]OGH07354.1 MAG: hypothetical protein A2600_07480 [Candidatus Lambdaproteobacteria bacterium RIFOXYD1_FULL_56_27]
MAVQGPSKSPRKEKRVSEPVKKPLKIREILIRNYKGIDDLKVIFPPPLMPEDPDIMVLGSQNGVGKTSVIECCALLLLAFSWGSSRKLMRRWRSSFDIPDFLIRTGAESAEIEGKLELGPENTVQVTLTIDRRGRIQVVKSDEMAVEMLEDEQTKREEFDPEEDEVVRAICGLTPNPVLEHSFLLFHSYRKVQEGNPELGMMVSPDRGLRRPGLGPRGEDVMSVFKLLILRSLMGKANLFEFKKGEKGEEAGTIDKLNELIDLYAFGKLGKLRPSQDNTVEIRVTQNNEEQSFTFDGLSSGQKEIISTLFLLWYHSKKQPMVVFIDEPELHLNVQWHNSFVRQLVKLAPENQYILATHSEEIIGSVEKDHRALLIR